MARYSLGIDIGGTFTDIVVYDHDADRQVSGKVLTTPEDPAEGAIRGLCDLLADTRFAPHGFVRVVHATTLFTNALIERKGALTGLVTTEGFRDTLEIGRERKYDLYDIAPTKPEPLVPRHLRLEVAERTTADGRIHRALDENGLLAVAHRLHESGAQSIAVVFLHAYANPAHERAAIALLREHFPDLAVTASYEVAPEVREYERTSTTVANAYIKPLAESYVDRMQARIAQQGIAAPLLLMLSSGGLTHTDEAKRVPVQMLESGPAAGALAGAYFGREDTGGDLLAFDMGGTTAKLSLVEHGEPLIAYTFEAARERRFVEGSGLPLRISTVELIEIGAGGGSIARADHLGLLKVGPHSAGARPGPAAYGRGGIEPTVTDADFVLGYLNPDYFAGGAVAVDMPAAERALGALAGRLGLGLTETAWGVHDVVDESMAGAARVHIAERGRDPRRFTLLATGGAGPVHAYHVARKLGLRRVVCPPSAGVASALGLLVAPARVDRVATVGMRLDAGDWQRLEHAYRDLEAEARRVIADTGLDPESAVVQRLADGRYVGQAFDLVVALPPGPYDGEDAEGIATRLTGAFEAAYREKFARTPPDVALEFINVRVSLRAPALGGAMAPRSVESGAGARAVKGERPVYFPETDGYIATPVYDRYRLGPGDRFEGPAVVEEEGSTVVVGPGARVEISPSGNLVVGLPGE